MAEPAEAALEEGEAQELLAQMPLEGSFFANAVKFSLIDKFEATPPAITKVFLIFFLFFKNSFIATLVFS